jgi:hypothetical protein
VAVILIAAATAGACARTIDPRLVEDAQTAVRVKTALVNDAQIGARLIEVRVSRGVVRLFGNVASAAEADLALKLAQSVPGVVKVDSDLRIRPEPQRPESGVTSPLETAQEQGMEDAPRARDWLALGVSASRRQPIDDRVDSSWMIYPLVRVGSRTGLGPRLGFTWFSADLRAIRSGASPVGRLRVRPVMAGVGYTVRRGRGSMDVSIVGGLAFNRFTTTTVPAGEPVPVALDNSLAWRPGLSVWYDPTGRAALNLSAGYVITRPRLTLLYEGRLNRRSLRADTAVFSVGLAYKLF